MPAMLSGTPFIDVLIGWRGADARTRAHLLRAFCSGIRLRSLISNSITLSIVVGIIIAETREPLHGGWLATIILAGLAPRLYAGYLSRQGRFEQAPERKALNFIAISALYGLLWGAGPFLLLPQLDGPATGILLFVMVFGTVMGPYATMPGILYARLATTGTATLVAVALYTTPQVFIACAVVSVWLVLRTDVWRGYHCTLRQQFELQETLEARQAELELANCSKEEANRRLQEIAETDSLTGASNRRQFTRQLGALRGPAALILLDVDHFKLVNDEFGHLLGDAVLIDLVRLVRKLLRKDDVLARIGGEEFGIVLPGMDADGAWVLAERVRQAVERHVLVVGEHEIGITVSLGVAALLPGEPAGQASDLLRRADTALYEAKGKGRNATSVAGCGTAAV